MHNITSQKIAGGVLSVILLTGAGTAVLAAQTDDSATTDTPETPPIEDTAPFEHPSREQMEAMHTALENRDYAEWVRLSEEAGDEMAQFIQEDEFDAFAQMMEDRHSKGPGHMGMHGHGPHSDNESGT